MKTTKLDNDTQYGSAANGSQVGSGFDVEIKRAGSRFALLNVIELATKDEWLGMVSVEADEDLQSLAVQIGQAPGDWLHDMEFKTDDDESDGWEDCAARWDAIEVA